MVTTRAFGAGDKVSIWDLLNEIRGWVDALSSEGVVARYWRGRLPADRSIANGNYTSWKPNNVIESAGLTPTWTGDVFRLPAGVYRIEWQMTFDNDADGTRATYLMMNPGAATVFNQGGYFPGATLRASRVSPSSGGAVTTLSPAAVTRRVLATDRFFLGCQHTAGNALNIQSGPQDTELIITRIGD